MQVSVNSSFLSASYALITAKKIGDIPCRKFLPKPAPGLEYYTLEDKSVRQINERYYSMHGVVLHLYNHHLTYRSAAARTKRFSRILQTVPYPYSLADFFRSIEESNSKGDFKVGLEARCITYIISNLTQK